MSLILITFSLDLCVDTVRRNLKLVTLRDERVKDSQCMQLVKKKPVEHVGKSEIIIET